MKEVKEKQRMKAPKTHDPTRRMPRTAQKAYGKVNEIIPAGEEQYQSADDYAVQKAEEYTQESADKAYHGAKKTVQRTKDEVRNIHDRIQEHQQERHDQTETPRQEAPQRPEPRMREQESVMKPKEESVSAQEQPVSEAHVPTAQRQHEILEHQRAAEEPVTAPEQASVRAEGVQEPYSAPTHTRIQEGGYQNAVQTTEGQVHSVQSYNRPVSTEKTTVQKTIVHERNTVSTVKQVPQRAVKSTEKTVKTADRTVKTTKTTVKTAEKTAEKTAKTAEKAAKAAKEAAVKAAQAAAKAAEYTAKAIEAAVKAIIAAVKELIAAIAAGGWVAVVVILIVALVALIVASCFGLFWSNDTSTGTPMSAIISSIDQAYQSKIDKAAKRLEDEIDHDEFEIVYRGDNNDGDSVAVYNWNDVLAVYAVLYTTGDNQVVMIEPSDETERKLSEVFNVMNRVTITYEIKEEVPEDAPKPTPDPDGNTPDPETVTVLIVNVHQYAMTYKEAARHYGFDENQMQMLEEMMSPAYYSYYAALIGVDVYGGTNYTEIISHLPPNSKGAEVVKAAMTRLGCPYVWGAKGSTKFDCSGLAYWSIHEVDPALGDRMYTNAAGQAKYCYDRGLTVGRSELQPGDLVFWVNKKCEGCHRWKEIHHVGIYIGEGKVIEAASGKGRVLIRDLWESKNYPILMFGRPYQ